MLLTPEVYEKVKGQASNSSDSNVAYLADNNQGVPGLVGLLRSDNPAAIEQAGLNALNSYRRGQFPIRREVLSHSQLR